MRAKRGFCLAMMGRDEEAETLLTVGNAGEHPLARAILAWMLAGPYGQRLRGGFGTKEQLEARAQRRATVRSAERRVGTEWVSTCRSRWSPCHKNKNTPLATTRNNHF